MKWLIFSCLIGYTALVSSQEFTDKIVLNNSDTLDCAISSVDTYSTTFIAKLNGKIVINTKQNEEILDRFINGEWESVKNVEKVVEIDTLETEPSIAELKRQIDILEGDVVQMKSSQVKSQRVRPISDYDFERRKRNARAWIITSIVSAATGRVISYLMLDGEVSRQKVYIAGAISISTLALAITSGTLGIVNLVEAYRY